MKKRRTNAARDLFAVKQEGRMMTVTPQRQAGLQIDKGLARQLFNRIVSLVLRSPLHGLAGLSRVAMLLTYTGVRSGRRYTLPLAYIRAGDTVITFALFTNTVWWKNLRGGAPVTLRLEGQDWPGMATVITDPEAVTAGLLAFHAANPAMSSRGYYAVPRLPDGSVDVAALPVLAPSRVMVQIQLRPA